MSERSVANYLRLLRPEYKPYAHSVTHQHVMSAEAGTGGDRELAAKVLEKASKEELSTRKTREVAEALRNAKGVPEYERAILEMPVNSHDTAETIERDARNLVSSKAGSRGSGVSIERSQGKITSSKKAAIPWSETEVGSKVYKHLTTGQNAATDLIDLLDFAGVPATDRRDLMDAVQQTIAEWDRLEAKLSQSGTEQALTRIERNLKFLGVPTQNIMEDIKSRVKK